MVPSVDSSPCCSADEFQATLSWLSPPLGLSGKVGRQGCQETSDSAIWPIRRQNVLNLKQPQELNLFFLRPLLAVECSVKMSSSFGGGRRGEFAASDDSWEPWETSLRDEKRPRRDGTCMSRSQVQSSEMEVDDEGTLSPQCSAPGA